jgi:hypothetical protein
MATFDQLPAEQRAILELVVGRGQTYDELSGMLGMPASRVRELAREALGDLAPATAARVDADWRAQIADYVLGQQSGPESAATKGHLARSEAARSWAYSLLDSLAHLYPQGELPEIPEGGAEPAPAPEARPATPRSATPQAPVRAKPAVSLSPAAQTVVRRRRIIGAAVGLLVVAAVIVVLVTGVLGGGDDNKGSTTASTNPNSRAFAYEVWLYNSSSSALPLGAQFTDAQGNLQGRGALPKNWKSYKSVILSRERVGSDPKSPANIVVQATINVVPAKTAKAKNGVKLVAEGVLKAAQGQTGAGVVVVLVQAGQQQLVVQAARLKPTTQVISPSSGGSGNGGSTTPGTTPTTP